MQEIDSYKRIRNGLEICCRSGYKIRLQVIEDGMIRVRCISSDGNFSLPALIRYWFVRDECQVPTFEIKAEKDNIKLHTENLTVEIKKSPFLISFYDKEHNLLTKEVANSGMRYLERGYQVTMALDSNEQFFGFGDQARKTIEHHGQKPIMWIKNVNSYIPIPFFMSTKGYGIFVNTTWKHYFDMGAASAKRYFWKALGGNIDYYFIYGPDFKNILNRYTALTGKPPLPPIWTFGLWFLCRMCADDKELMDNARSFRDKHIPCDILGLEPGWMKKFYDFSTRREWHPERFKVEPWSINQHRTFIATLKRMGYKLELWECNDYDLSIEAEKQTGVSLQNKQKEKYPEAGENIKGEFPLVPDVPWGDPSIKMDKLTNPDESWFEHHKKFIDLGVDFFKQDGSNQTLEHPDRHWANGMSDEEMHNLYPLLYSQQMYEGFKKHTKRRPICFTPNGWAGLQRYTGTWAGDTGGGPEVVVASLNLALCGHTYTTCDMDVTSSEGIHFGFLQPWAQINSFGTWDHPWLLGDKLWPIFEYYAKLRYQLLYYIYSHAYESYKTGVPIIRPMLLEFPDDPKTFSLTKQYMLGRELLVGAFTNKVYLPKGEWIDYWTGKEYKGPCEIKCKIPKDRGGLLFVRSNSIIPMGPIVDYIGQKPLVTITLDIYPGEKKGHFTLYEDDGVSFGYEKNQFTTTLFECSQKDRRILITIGKRKGKYQNMPKERRYILKIHLGTKPKNVSRGRFNFEETKTKDELCRMKNIWWYNHDKKILWIRAKGDLTSLFKIDL